MLTLFPEAELPFEVEVVAALKSEYARKNPLGQRIVPFEPDENGEIWLTKEEMKEATFIRPGLDGPDAQEIPIEALTASTQLSPVDIVLFHDAHEKRPVDDTQCNQWAFVVDDKRALYLRGVVRSLKLAELHTLPHASLVKRVPEPLAPYVANMLLRYRWRPFMFGCVLKLIRYNNYIPIVQGRFFPPDPTYRTDEDYEAAWEEFVSELEPGDSIFTYDRSSLVSKLIAFTTRGPFSHVAMYIGNGEIAEVDTAGSQVVRIESYKGRHFRVAAYRLYGLEQDAIQKSLAKARAQAGKLGYNYFGAFKAGVRTLFGKPQHFDTPNSMILDGYLTFIIQA